MEVIAAGIVGGLVSHLISGGTTVKFGDKEIELNKAYYLGSFAHQLFDDTRKDNKRDALKKLGHVSNDIKHHNAFFKINGVEYKLHLDTTSTPYKYILTKK